MIRPSRNLTPEQVKEKVCGNKQKYNSRKQAKEAQKLMSKKYKARMNAYKCDYCEFYHIGRRTGESNA